MYKELGEDSQSQWARQPVPFSTSQFLFLSVVGPLHQWLSTNFLLIVASSVHLQISETSLSILFSPASVRSISTTLVALNYNILPQLSEAVVLWLNFNL